MPTTTRRARHRAPHAPRVPAAVADGGSRWTDCRGGRRDRRLELVSHGVLPGRQFLDQVDGACSVPQPSWRTRRSVLMVFGGLPVQRPAGERWGTRSPPPGHGSGQFAPPDVIAARVRREPQPTRVAGMSPAQAVALHVEDRPLPPMAMGSPSTAVADTGIRTQRRSLGMVVNELTRCAGGWASDVPPNGSGSMASRWVATARSCWPERYPNLIAAVAATQPRPSGPPTHRLGRPIRGRTRRRRTSSPDDAITHAGAWPASPSGWPQGRRPVPPRRGWHSSRRCRAARGSRSRRVATPGRSSLRKSRPSDGVSGSPSHVHLDIPRL